LEDAMKDNGTFWLAAVNLIIWTGLFFYMWRIENKIARRERNSKP
jgi:CcmD family protein